MLRRIILLACVAACGCGGTDSTTAPPPPTTAIETPGTHTRSIQAAGFDRTYSVYVPEGVLDGPDAPAILVLHGNPPVDMALVTAMNDLADERGFYAVYPQSAFGEEWVHSCRCTINGERGVDDDAYFEALLTDLATAVPLDDGRAYVTGFSNGGMMTYGLACRLADRFAGFGAVEAGMWRWLTEHCTGPAPARILMINGTEDPSFPWDGLQIETATGARLTQIPILEHVAFWADRNDCAAEPEVESLPDLTDDGTTVQRWSYVGCDAPTVFYRIEGGGHTWPDMPVNFSPSLGTKSRDINASRVLVDFFLGAP